MLTVALFIVAIMTAGTSIWLVAGAALVEMRNRRGLYHWSRPVQFLICLADGIPVKHVGRYPTQQAFRDAFFDERSMISYQAEYYRLLSSTAVRQAWR